MKNYIALFTFLLFVNVLSAQNETNKELHSDGGAWAVKVIQEEGDKTVLLIGNSISNGYKGSVAKELKNCRVVAWVNPYHLAEESLHEDLINVLQREKYDVIHFNIGLHGWSEERIPRGQNQHLLQKYIDILYEYAPDSKIIWATVTPITNKVKPYVPNAEFNQVIESRNQIAAVVMKDNGIPVNDLYGLCLLNMNLARGDKYHWTSPMMKMMAIQIASKIRVELSQIHEVAEKPEVLFLLGGQSNMAGNGFTQDLSDAHRYRPYRRAPKNVSVWDARNKQWKPLELGDRFGPEIGFAHALSKAMPDKHIGIVKYAVGGTSMDKWKSTGKLYKQLLGDYENALNSTPDAKLEAMLWHQGESDSDDKEVAEVYQDKLVQHIHSIRKDTGEENLLFILGQINPAKNFRGRDRFQYAKMVRKAQAELNMYNVEMIKTDDCKKNAYIHGAVGTTQEQQIPENEDNIHYSADGQLKLGKRFAESYLTQTEK